MRKAAFYSIFVVLSIFLAGARPGAAAPSYTYLDLKTAEGNKVTYPRGIDAAGEVVGYGYLLSSSQAVLNQSGAGSAAEPGPLTDGTSEPYPLLWGPFGIPLAAWFSPPTPNAGSTAQNICTGGNHLTGWWMDTSNNKHAYQVNRTGDSNWELPLLDGETGSWGNGINDSGDVVGGAFTASGQRAFLYRGGAKLDLGYGEARGINNAGQVVGNTDTGHAFLYDGAMHDLGTLDAPYNSASDAYAINDSGQVVGSSQAMSGDAHAFLYDGTMHDLGTLPEGRYCLAYAINNRGQVVGYSAADSTRAFLYSGGVMYDLTSLVQNLPAGIVIEIAYGINDRGQIIANTSNAHGVLLTPVTPVSVLPLLLD